MWSRLCHSQRTSPVRHVDLLDRRVDDRPVARAAQRREVAADRVVGGDVGDAVGGDLEVVQVGVQPVAAGHPRNGLVAGAHHHVFALAEAQFEHAPPPPRQVAPPFVGLLVEVLRRFAAGQPVEPHEPALRGVDQRAILAGTGPVGREDVARGGIAVGHGHAQDRHLRAGQRGEALVVGGRRARVAELRDGARRVGGVDAEFERHLPGGAAGADRGMHGHALAGVERRVGHEAGAVALRVAAKAAGVSAAALRR